MGSARAAATAPSDSPILRRQAGVRTMRLQDLQPVRPSIWFDNQFSTGVRRPPTRPARRTLEAARGNPYTRHSHRITPCRATPVNPLLVYDSAVLVGPRHAVRTIARRRCVGRRCVCLADWSRSSQRRSRAMRAFVGLHRRLARFASNEKCVFVSRATGFMDSLAFGDQAIATRDRNIRRIDHRLRPLDVSFEAKRFRHRAITITNPGRQCRRRGPGPAAPAAAAARCRA